MPSASHPSVVYLPLKFNEVMTSLRAWTTRSFVGLRCAKARLSTRAKRSLGSEQMQNFCLSTNHEKLRRDNFGKPSQVSKVCVLLRFKLNVRQLRLNTRPLVEIKITVFFYFFCKNYFSSKVEAPLSCATFMPVLRFSVSLIAPMNNFDSDEGIKSPFSRN